MTSKCHLDCLIYKIKTDFIPLILAQIPKLKQLPTINSQPKTNIFFKRIPIPILIVNTVMRATKKVKLKRSMSQLLFFDNMLIKLTSCFQWSAWEFNACDGQNHRELLGIKTK